jgi:hypothetical protein
LSIWKGGVQRQFVPFRRTLSMGIRMKGDARRPILDDLQRISCSMFLAE